MTRKPARSRTGDAFRTASRAKKRASGRQTCIAGHTPPGRKRHPVPHWLDLMLQSLGPLLAAGLRFTVPLTLIAFVLGLGLGLGTALVRLFAPRPLAALAWLYVWIFRGTPLLVQLFVIFYGLPSAGILIDAFPAAVIGFTLNVGAYTSEIIRAAIASLPRGQWEASYAIGMTPSQTLRRTILPQAARVAVPPLGNSFIALVKDTSLAAAITVPELFQAAQRIVAVTYEPLILYIEAALIYLVLSSLLSWLQTLLERRLGRYGGYLEARA
jgi:L-cystine transport system permease protein